MRTVKRILRTVLPAVVLLTIALPAHGQTGHPASISLEAGSSLPRAAQAARVHLLGLLELYDIALYTNVPARDTGRLAGPDVAKALRIEIQYEEDFRRQLTIEWQRELIPPLNHAAIDHLRQTFAPLKRGDVVLIEYVPGKGTAVRVNKTVVTSGINHDLMLAFLDHWLGQRPVSEELKRAVLNRGSSS